MPRDFAEEMNEIEQALALFTGAMRAKLAGKASQGWRGWDDPQFLENVRNRLFEHVDRLKKGERQEIDIANLAMMLWFQRVNPLLEEIYYGKKRPSEKRTDGK